MEMICQCRLLIRSGALKMDGNRIANKYCTAGGREFILGKYLVKCKIGLTFQGDEYSIRLIWFEH